MGEGTEEGVATFVSRLLSSTEQSWPLMLAGGLFFLWQRQRQENSPETRADSGSGEVMDKAARHEEILRLQEVSRQLQHDSALALEARGLLKTQMKKVFDRFARMENRRGTSAD